MQPHLSDSTVQDQDGASAAGAWRRVRGRAHLTKMACSRLVPTGMLSRSGSLANPSPLGSMIQKRARGDSVPTITSPAYLASEGAGTEEFGVVGVGEEGEDDAGRHGRVFNREWSIVNPGPF